MKIELIWGQPIQLRNGASENLIFSFDLDEIPDASGIYVFGRKRGSEIIPVYIGQAQVLWKRLRRQRNNLQLMMALKNSPGRKKFLTYAKLVGKPGQVVAKALDTTESALIEHALASGFDIVNVMGAKRKKHTIESRGGRGGRQWAPRTLAVEKRR